MSKKKTPWFDGGIRPTRIGVYERNDRNTWLYDGMPNFSYWNGEVWCTSAPNVSGASFDKRIQSGIQNLPWRGLAQKPEAT